MNELLRTILFLPPQASTIAHEIDGLHYFVILTTMAGAAAITVIGGYFLVRYKRRRFTPQPRRYRGMPRRGVPLWLEITLIGGLASLFVTWWVIGFRQFMKLRVAPENAMDVYVFAKKWMWKFAYPDGGGSISNLYVPANRPIRLVLTSRDVIHSFYVPDFRVKMDAIPGRYTTVWFEAKAPGVYEILCTEYCGTGHSTMRGAVVVLSAEDYDRWLRSGREPTWPEPEPPVYVPPAVVGQHTPKDQPVSLVEAGLRAAAQYGCLRCHTTDGTPHIGPTWAGVYRTRVPLQDGTTVLADEAYLTESMMDPLAKIRRGFQPVMPSYHGQLPPADTAAIVELIKSVRDRTTTAPPRPEFVVAPAPPVPRSPADAGAGIPPARGSEAP